MHRTYRGFKLLVGRRYLLALALIGVSVGCSMDYDQIRVAEEISAEIPETTIRSFTHTVVRNGRRAFSIQADVSESYPEQDTQLLQGIYFVEFDSNEDIVTEGIAGRAILFTDTENVEIYEGIEFYTKREESGLSADYLFWNDEDRILTSEPEATVTLRRDDGSEVGGEGFRADMKYKTMSFERNVQGVYVSEDEDE